MPRMTLLVLGVTVLSGVAALVVDHAEAWPDGIPSRERYERIWESDPRLQRLQTREQYLARVLRFYSGSAGLPGWTWRQAQLVRPLGAGQARRAVPEATLLGQVISSEYSKPDPIRRISPKTLRLWGQVLSDVRESDQLVPVLEHLCADARSLVEGRLEPSAVTADRYDAMILTKEIPR